MPSVSPAARRASEERRSTGSWSASSDGRNGQVVRKDPDPRIRLSLIREFFANK